MDEQFKGKILKIGTGAAALMKRPLGKEGSKKDFKALSAPCPAPSENLH